MAVAVAYETLVQGVTTAGQVSFASTDIGTAAADRLVVLAISWCVGGSDTITSVTIAGIAAVQLGLAIDAVPANDEFVAIYAASVPTGTTGTIVVNLTGDGGVSVGVYSVTGSGTTPIPYSIATASGTAASLSITNLTIPTDGAAICNFINNNHLSTVAWTNATENFDAANDNLTRHSGAVRTTAGTTTITATCASNDQALLGVAFAPYPFTSVIGGFYTFGGVSRSGSTWTFTDLPIGPPAADRLVVCCFTTETTDAFSSFTINGSAATQVVRAVDGTGHHSMIYAAEVASGETADIVVTHANSGTAVGIISVYSLYNVEPTAVDSGSVADTDGTSTLATVTVPTNGFGVWCLNNGAQGTAIGWTNATEDSDVNANIHRHGCASTRTAGTPSVTATGSAVEQQLVGAAFGPKIITTPRKMFQYRERRV